MDLKIHNLQQISQPERITQTPEADGSFRFTLLSNIEESELQAALSGMLCAEGIARNGVPEKAPRWRISATRPIF